MFGGSSKGPGADAGVDVVAGHPAVRKLPEGRSVGIGRHVDREAQVVDVALSLRERQTFLLRPADKPLGRIVELRLDGIIGLHLQHQVNTTGKIESVVDLLSGRVQRPHTEGHHYQNQYYSP